MKKEKDRRSKKKKKSPTPGNRSDPGIFDASNAELGNAAVPPAIELQQRGNPGSVHVIPVQDLNLDAEPFAAGGGGQIFRGKYMGHLIAAKQVFASSSSGKADMDGFEREVRMLCQLSHPSIVNLYGISSKPGSAVTYMVLEYCGGGDLAGYYKTPAFNNTEFTRIMSEILGALRYLHECDIAHKDLKPANSTLSAGYAGNFALCAKMCEHQ